MRTMFPVVVLDIETTGLDPLRDAIIEIGAVRYDGSGINDTWHSMVNPQRLVPAEITQLTGIDTSMVQDAPLIQQIMPQLVDFLGSAPIVGHNVSFDLSFLKIHHPLDSNKAIDTFELASVLLPRGPRYSLAALVEVLALENLSPHRAQEDAEATLSVFLKLIEIAHKLPLSLIAEIVKASRNIPWDAGWFLQEILRERSKEPMQAKQSRQVDYGVLFAEPSEMLAQPLKPNETLIPLDLDEVTAVLSPGGLFSKSLDHFESRYEQVEMLQAVGKALTNSQHLMVEAGTGIGKSFAYLVPAAMWSMQNQMRVVVSTNTLNLQDQLIAKDIPDLKKAMGIDLKASVLKGRSNYLCPRRLEALRHRLPRDASELRLLAKVLVWLEQGGSGELQELSLTGPADRDNWDRLSAQDEACNADVCLNRMGGICPYYRAHQAALSSHILIVNHALLLSDVVSGSRVLPDFRYLIVDEGHHLEEASTQSLSYRVTHGEVDRLFSELGGISSGLIGSIASALKQLLKPSEYASAEAAMQHINDLALRSSSEFNHFFFQLDAFLEQERDGQEIGEYGQQVRIIPATQTQPIWSDVQIVWERVSKPMDQLQRLLNNLLQEMGDAHLVNHEVFEDQMGDLGSVIRRLQEMHQHVNELVFDLDGNTIYWVEVDFKFKRLSLNFAPLQIGPLMENYLWHTKESVIITSATLTAGDEFDYLRSRLNADEADELVLGSPFDYENAAMLYLPSDMPEPTDYKNYQRVLERAIIRTARATGGRMLVLFTSYRQLKAASHVVSPILAKEGIQVYEQGDGASSSSLLESFKNAEQAVLLGTKSFWEGVDVPGEALSMLMITKLPFDVPSDPIIAARAESFEDAFNEYLVPEAVLRFRQGFGRLIRSQSDRGVVAVMDRRLRTKRYGERFIHALPPCHIVEKPVEDLPDEAARWLNL